MQASTQWTAGQAKARRRQPDAWCGRSKTPGCLPAYMAQIGCNIKCLGNPQYQIFTTGAQNSGRPSARIHQRRRARPNWKRPCWRQRVAHTPPATEPEPGPARQNSRQPEPQLHASTAGPITSRAFSHGRENLALPVKQHRGRKKRDVGGTMAPPTRYR